MPPAEFERDTAEHQPQQHRDNQRIGRGQHHCVGEREGGEEPAAAEHQPGLVAVPHRCDSVHRAVTLAVPEGREQDADAEVEPVHHHIGEHREGDDESPDHGEVHQLASPSSSGNASALLGFCVGPGVIPAARTGPRAVDFTPFSPGCGGLAMSRRIYQMPTENAAQ